MTAQSDTCLQLEYNHDVNHPSKIPFRIFTAPLTHTNSGSKRQEKTGEVEMECSIQVDVECCSERQMSSLLLRRILLPLLGTLVAFVVPGTLIISHAEEQYFDGLRFPFVTQAAREGGSYWWFGVGMTCVGITLVLIGNVTERWLHEVGAVMKVPQLSERFGHRVLVCLCSGRYERFGQVMKVFFWLSGFFFPMTAWTDHIAIHLQAPGLIAIHTYTTIAAFAGSTVAMAINACELRTLALGLA